MKTMQFKKAILDPSILASDRCCKILWQSDISRFFISGHFLSVLKNGPKDVISGFGSYLSKDNISSTDTILYTMKKISIQPFNWRNNVNRLYKLNELKEFKNFESIVSILEKQDKFIDEIWKDNLVFMLTSSPMLTRLKNSAEKTAKYLNKILIYPTEKIPIINLEKSVPNNLKVYVKAVKKYANWICFIVSISGLALREVSLSLAFPIITGVRTVIIDP